MKCDAARFSVDSLRQNCLYRRAAHWCCWRCCNSSPRRGTSAKWAVCPVTTSTLHKPKSGSPNAPFARPSHPQARFIRRPDKGFRLRSMTVFTALAWRGCCWVCRAVSSRRFMSRFPSCSAPFLRLLLPFVRSLPLCHSRLRAGLRCFAFEPQIIDLRVRQINLSLEALLKSLSRQRRPVVRVVTALP